MSLFSTPAEPKPKGILDPSCCRAMPPEVRKPSRLKEAFLVPKPPGSLAKKTGTPLGKSYRRTQPLPCDSASGAVALRGPEVLATDPRGSSASFGDGHVPPSPLHRVSATSALSVTSVGTYSSRSTAASSTAASSNAASSTDLETPRVSGSEPAQPGFPSTSSTSIRFCPLPSTGRPRARAQSFSIGIASRSQLLSLQGRAAAPQRQPAPGMYTRAPPPVPDDVVDLGEVMHKGVKKIMKRLRKDQSASSSPTATDGRASFTPTVDASEKERPAGRSNSINLAELAIHPDAVARRTKQGQVVPECARDDADDRNSVEFLSEVHSLPPSQQVWAHPDPFADDAQQAARDVDDKIPLEGAAARSPAPSSVRRQ